MRLDQTTITLAITLGVTLFYSCATHYRRRRLTYDGVLMFGLLCAASVTGIYIVIGAFRTPDPNAIYSGVFGGVLFVVPLQRIIFRLEAVCKRPPAKDTTTTEV
jgi:hypothetical protein